MEQMNEVCKRLEAISCVICVRERALSQTKIGWLAMSEQNKWEIDKLKEKEEEERRQRKEHEKRLRELELFRVETIERLKSLFNKIKDIESSNQFVSKSFFTVILGGIVTAVGALIKWLMG